MKVLNNVNTRRILIVLAVILAVAILAYLIIHGRHYFSRRIIRQLQEWISSYETWSPLMVLLLIFLSTAIPPLPLPVPLVEIASGVIFGFWMGFLLIWVAQISSSLFAFLASRYFGNRFLQKLLSSRIWSFYRQYLRKKGSLAVFITRALMASPFNIISYLSGLSQMSLGSFTLATIFGTIPEAALFALVGSSLRSIRVSLWYLFILVILLGAMGWVLTIILMKFFNPKLQDKSIKSAY